MRRALPVVTVASPDFREEPQGLWEVYREPYPQMTGRRKVSGAGVEEPRWSANGRLFYRSGNTIFTVPFDLASGDAGAPRPFVSGPFVNVSNQSYVPSRDGKRLLIIRGPAETTGNHIRVIRNLLGEIKRVEPRR